MLLPNNVVSWVVLWLAHSSLFSWLCSLLLSLLDKTGLVSVSFSSILCSILYGTRNSTKRPSSLGLNMLRDSVNYICQQICCFPVVSMLRLFLWRLTSHLVVVLRLLPCIILLQQNLVLSLQFVWSLHNMLVWVARTFNFVDWWQLGCLIIHQHQKTSRWLHFIFWFIFNSFQLFLYFSYKTVWYCQTLANCRSEVCKALGIPEEQCELSMGMSGDFEQAVRIIFIFYLEKEKMDL